MITEPKAALPPGERSVPLLGRREAAVDLLAFVVVSGIVFGLEKGLRHAGLSPFPSHFDGGLSLIGSLLLVAALLRKRGQGWADLGLRRPERWWTVPVWGLVVLTVSIVAQLTVVPVLGALLGVPPPDLTRYDAIVGNLPMFVVSAAGAMVTGGFIEEVIYRGLVLDRFHRLLGGGRVASVGAAIGCGIPFGLIHFEWGIGGIVVTTVMGSVLGLMALATRRNLWPLIAAHATLDLLLMLQLYLGMLSPG